MTPDVNVLVAASRLDHPHHSPALAWLDAAVIGLAVVLCRVRGTSRSLSAVSRG